MEWFKYIQFFTWMYKYLHCVLFLAWPHEAAYDSSVKWAYVIPENIILCFISRSRSMCMNHVPKKQASKISTQII